MRFFFLLLLLFFQAQIFSQQDWEPKKYAAQLIDTLSSGFFYGRGYVNDGDKLASEYLSKKFKEYQLQTFGEDYFQSFHFPVNTFPGKLACSFSGKEMQTGKRCYVETKLGENMLIGAASPSIKGKYRVIIFDSLYTTSDQVFENFRLKLLSERCFILVDDRGVTDKEKKNYFRKVKENFFKAAGVVTLENKLTHSISTETNDYVTIKLQADSFVSFFSAVNELYLNITVQNKLIENHHARNVIGYIKGTVQPDSFIIFSAHYDHLGQLGKEVFFPGANDNASGCAMLLSLIRHYSAHPPGYSVVFIAFAAEEAGLIGSSYYVQHPLFPLNSIRFLLNMDIMGTGDEGITVVNGTVFKAEFDKLVELNKEGKYLNEIKIRGKAANSDHYPFSERGVRAFFIYTMGGIKAYHDVYDKAETLPLTKFNELFKLFIFFENSLEASKS